MATQEVRPAYGTTVTDSRAEVVDDRRTTQAIMPTWSPAQIVGLIVGIEPFAKRHIGDFLGVRLRHMKHRLGELPPLGKRQRRELRQRRRKMQRRGKSVDAE